MTDRKSIDPGKWIKGFTKGVRSFFTGEQNPLTSYSTPNLSDVNAGDLSLPSVGFGRPIQRVYGTARVGTTLFWAGPIRRNDSDPDRADGLPNVRYYADFAVIIAGNPQIGLSRIWFNGRLFYENRPYLTGDPLTVSNDAEGFFNFYDGRGSKTASTVITAIDGAAVTPDYKHLSYLVFTDIDVTDYNNQIPTVSVETVNYGTGYDAEDSTIKPMPIPLHMVIKDLVSDCGLSDADYDCTQLTKTIDGYVYNGTDNVLNVIQHLGDIHGFYMREDGEKLVFQIEPTPLSRIEHNTSCMINENYLIANAFHDEIGRQGYFPSESGTSEGQFLMIRAACQAYVASNNNDWLVLAQNMASAAETLFQIPPPSSGSGILYLPHWLFNVRKPIQMQSSILAYRLVLTKSGSDWTGNIESGPGGYGDLVNTVFGAIEQYQAFYTWENPYASVQGTGYGAPSSFTVSSSGCSCTWTDAALGSPSGSTFVVYVRYKIEAGPMLAVGENMEAWPHWRRTEPGEIDCAVDTLSWSWSAYDLLYKITSDTDYQDRRTAVGETIDDVFDIDDGRNWIRPTRGSPYAIPGTYISGDRTGWSQGSVYRNSAKNIVMFIRAGTGEAQYGRGITDQIKVGDTDIQVYIKSDGASDIDLFLQDGTDVGTATRYYYTITTTTSLATPHTIPLSSFSARTLQSGGWTEVSTGLPSGTDIDVVGFIYESAASENFEIQQARPIPEVQLTYTKGAAPYTANKLGETLVDWQGNPGIGYQDPMMWDYLADPLARGEMVDFILASQDEYNTLHSDLGPFVPAYVWDRFDALQLGGTPGDFTWTWPDPNSEWVGYTARCVAACAKTAWLVSDADCVTIADRFLTWLNNNWTSSSQFPPTNFPESIPTRANSTAYAVNDIMMLSTPNGRVYKCTVAGTSNGSDPGSWPTTIGNTHSDGSVTWECSGYIYGTANNIYGNYHEPHAVALFMRAAGYLHADGTSTAAMESLMQRCWDYLESRVNTGGGDMDGTWDNNGDWYGFWGAEIITTLSLFVTTSADSATIDDYLDTQRQTVTGMTSGAVFARIANYLTWLTANTRTVTDDAIEDLVLSDDYEVNRVQDVELPQEVSLEYLSPSRDGGTERRYARRQGTQSNNKIELKSPSHMQAQEAQNIVLRILYDTWARRQKYAFEEINWLLHAGDVKQITRNGTTEIIQYKRLTFNEGSVTVEAESYDSSVYAGADAPTYDTGGATGLDLPATTALGLMDINLLSDDDYDNGIYIAASANGSNWFGAKLYISNDDITYNLKSPELPILATIGVTSTVLPANDVNIIDRASTVTVTIVQGTISSITEAELLDGGNQCVIGNEILQFQTATLVTGQTYILSNLLRGRRGTNTFIYGHGASEIFTLINSAVARSTISTSKIGQYQYYRGVTNGQEVANAQTYQIQLAGNAYKPYSPAHLKGVRDASNNVDLTWIRRARYGGAWRDNAGVPLAEESELYTVTLYSNLPSLGGNAYITYAVSSPNHQVPVADITTYYGSGSATIYVGVSQYSSIVGDGYLTELTVT